MLAGLLFPFAARALQVLSKPTCSSKASEATISGAVSVFASCALQNIPAAKNPHINNFFISHSLVFVFVVYYFSQVKVCKPGFLLDE